MAKIKSIMLNNSKTWHSSKKTTAVLKTVLLYILYALLAAILMFPFYYILSRSIMTPIEANSRPIKIFPSEFSLDMWNKAFVEKDYLKYSLNTLKIVAFNIIAVPLSASFVAFGFAKCEFVGKKALFAIMLSMIMLPYAVVQVPIYVLFSKLNMLNSYKPLILPNIFGGGALNIFLIRQFMKSIPKDLDAAAKIDGAGYLMQFFVITLPLCVSVLIYIMVGVFVTNWGDYYGPLIYMSVAEESKFTLAYVIFRDYNASIPNLGDEGMRGAAGVLMSLPPLLLFFLFQRKLVDGVVMAGIKG